MSLTRTRVHLLATPDSTGSTLYGLYDTFSAVGVVWPVLVRGETGSAPFDVQIVARRKTPFRCYGGVPVAPHAKLDEISQTDVICVPNVRMPSGRTPSGRFTKEVAWLREMHAGGALVASACSGALMLAEAGFLDCEDATSHWAYSEFFRKRYPDVRFRPERVLTFAGEGQRVITAGSISSWQDLALYLIARFCGNDEAIRTAKIFAFCDHQDGQLHYASLAPKSQHDDPVVRECQEWLVYHYTEAHPVKKMVEISGLARRTFSRRFRAATGYQPMDYVEAVRVEEAKQMLERSEVPVEDVAAEVGYSDPTSFARLFKRMTGLTPSIYRRRLGHKRIPKSE